MSIKRPPCHHHWKLTTTMGGLKLYHCRHCGDYYGKHAFYGWMTMYAIHEQMKKDYPRGYK